MSVFADSLADGLFLVLIIGGALVYFAFKGAGAMFRAAPPSVREAAADKGLSLLGQLIVRIFKK